MRSTAWHDAYSVQCIKVELQGYMVRSLLKSGYDYTPAKDIIILPSFFKRMGTS